jgi:hypothetical protein
MFFCILFVSYYKLKNCRMQEVVKSQYSLMIFEILNILWIIRKNKFF